MIPGLAQTLRSRWFIASVHCGFWLVLCVALVKIGGKAPDFREAESASAPAQSPAPVSKLERLFSPAAWPKSPPDTNTLNPFFTRHFVPPPTQAPPPPPPAPTTRKIEVTYQGFYQTGDGPQHVLVKLAAALVFAPVGAKLTNNVFIAQAGMKELTVTNHADQTNLLLLNTKKELELPIQ